MMFPLRLSPNKRYLLDRHGTPFLYHADTAWRLPQRLRREDVVRYLDNRVARGYTTVHIHAINKEKQGPLNPYGQLPFDPLDDISRPNMQYWQHLDYVMGAIAERGMLALISAAWFGYRGAGWRPQLSAESAYTYGRFLGSRYGRFPNIVWVQGGDNDPGDQAVAAAALAHGIRETAPHHLQTYHAAAEHASAVFFHDAPWLDINFGYTYEPAYKHILAEYNRPAPIRPLILGETGYDDESNTGFLWTTKLVRQQPYWAFLSGAAGHAHGSGSMWHFDAGWEATLDQTADQHMAYLLELLRSRAWHLLIPDQDHTLLTSGSEQGHTFAAAARAEDGSFALIYLPTRRTIEVDLSRFGGPPRAQWYDPTSGSYSPIADPLDPEITSRRLEPPGANSAGDDDWVLVLDAQERI